MKITSRTLLIAALAAAPATAAEPHAYRAARLWPGNGPAVADAVLVVRDGKVVAAGKRADVQIPPDAVVHDLGDATIIPGLIAAETALAERGRDDLVAITPQYRAADGFDPYGDYATALSGGVTTAQIAPGGRRLMPGQGAVVKLFGDDPAKRTLRDEESLRVVLGDAFKNPPRVYEPPVGAVSVDRPLEPTKAQPAGSLSGAVATLRAGFQAARDSRDTRDPFVRAMRSSGSPAKPVRVTAPIATDVQAALSLAKEFDLKLILVEPAVPREKLADWKAHVVGVVLSPGIRPGVAPDAEAPNRPFEAARDLRAAGIRAAIKPANDADLKEMLYLAGLFTSRVEAVDVLKMLTADAAELLGVADRVGTLAAGKDADFVVLTGEPFGLHTRVKTVYVEGKVAHAGKSGGPSKVVRAGKILTGTGAVIEGGSVLVEGGSIRAVGRDVSVPADADERRFANAVIVPGFLDLGNGLGVGGPLNQVSLGTKLGDRLISGEPAVKTARQGGVTTALLAPNSPAPGPVLAFKLGDKLRPVKEPVAVRFAVSGNLTSTGQSLRESLRTGKAYADGWTKYEADLADYQRKKKEFDEAAAKAPPPPKKDEKKDDKAPEAKKAEPPKEPSKPQLVEAMEPYRAMFAGKMPALVEAKREDAIKLAVTVFRDEFNVKMVLVDGDDAHRVADLLAAKSVGLISGPGLVRTVDREDVNLPLVMAMRGLPIGFQSQANAGAKHLPTAVGFAVRHGLGSEEALKGLTAGPAQFLGLDTLGTIAVGKDADLVVLSGMPFELSTRVLAVMIDGQWVYRDSEPARDDSEKR